MTETMTASQRFVRSALVAEVTRLLARCTDKQRGLFDRIYPTGIESLSEEKLRNAYRLCEATFRKNEQQPALTSQGTEQSPSLSADIHKENER